MSARGDPPIPVEPPVTATNSHPPGVRGRLSQLAGSLSNRVLEEVDADAVLEHVDIDALVARIDVDGLVARIDVDRLLARTDLEALVARVDPDALLERVDVDRLLDRVDVDRLLDRVDVDRLLDRVDVDRLLDRVDLEQLVRQAGIQELVAESTGQVAGSALDLGRRQLVGLDVGISRFLHRLLRRDPDALPAGPPTLVADDRGRIQAPDPEAARTKARFEVSGFYAGPVSRLVAFAGDVAVATSAFTAGVAALSWVLSTLFGAPLPSAEDGGVLWLLAFVAWLFVYWMAASAVVGRTPIMALAGLRIVARDGSPLRPRHVLVRTLVLPLSLLVFGVGGAWMVVDRERRALHDLLAGSTVVYDWGGRPAELPTPLARWIADHGGAA
jgi:uncharacterized RDD family membrane protein YckC